MSNENWVRAKALVPRCQRCDDWNKMGLSSRCPDCDKQILDHYIILETMSIEMEGDVYV